MEFTATYNYLHHSIIFLPISHRGCNNICSSTDMLKYDPYLLSHPS